MKKLILFFSALIGVVLLTTAFRTKEANYGFKLGTPEIKSISAIAFGTDGILFLGDSKSALVVAVDTKDKTVQTSPTKIELKNIDQKIAAALGTEVKNIRIKDMAVNPISKKIYLAVENIDGTPVVLAVEGDKIQSVSLKDVYHSTASIADVPSEDQKDRGGRSLRESVISDLQVTNGQVMVSGISNQEFSSTFRTIRFPFADQQDHASLEIYHAAHGKYETNSPIKTFTTATLNGKEYLVASYTCTPLVLFPMDQLKAGKHIKGRTVGEFGAGNSPIDMITIKKGDNSYLVIANNNRPLMRIKYKNIESFEGALTEPIKESFSTAGVEFVTLPVVNILQMDQFDEKTILVLQRKSNGDLDLITLSDWLIS